MFKPKLTLILAATLIGGASFQNTHAQTVSQNGDQAVSSQPALIEIAAEQVFRRKRMKRVVEPIAYWVDSTSLRLRDNPVSGKIVGNIDYGQEILAYSSYENWVRISKPDAKETWVNSDFLSNSRLSWASYNRSTPTRSSDVVFVRIKDPNNRKNRIFGVRLKVAETGNALITTRENSAQGVLYQNRFVSCDNKKVIGVRLVGEGYSFLSAQNDVRYHGLDIYAPQQIDNKAINGTEKAISKFACKTQSF